MSSIETLSDDALAEIVLTPLMLSLGARVGAVRLSQVLVIAGQKLAADIERDPAIAGGAGQSTARVNLRLVE